MKRFIRYLYEYEQGRRLRNVGFVKVEQGDDDCTLHIHGKGLHMKGERRLQLYLFYGGDECVGIWQGIVDNMNPAVNYRLYFTREDVVIPENFDKINGIILESELGHKYAAVWNEGPVNVGQMRVLRPESVQKRQDSSGGNAQGDTQEEMPGGGMGSRKETISKTEGIADQEELPGVSMGADEQEELPGRAEEMPVREDTPGGSMEEEQSEEIPERSEGMAVREDTSGGVMEEVQPEELPGGDTEGIQPEDTPVGVGGVQREEMPGGGMGKVQPEEASGRNGGTAQGEQNAAEGGADGQLRQADVRDGSRNLHQQEAEQFRPGCRCPRESTSAMPESERRNREEDESQGDMPRHVCSDQKEQKPESSFRCTKIQRNELAVLPRCEWKWANNSFLLHGYYNYHHLAFIDDGEKFRLGVPGIYHPQEAKAASTFGFTEFIPQRDIRIDLSEDEKSNEEQFGYWCRPIKRPLRMQ